MNTPTPASSPATAPGATDTTGPTGAIVIVGGGHAAASLCSALADAGQGHRVTLLCAEPVLPYQRPPLSKNFLKNAADAVMPHRAAAWYAEAGITVRLGTAVADIDRAARTVGLNGGERLAYEHLVLATGTVARRLPVLPASLRNVHVLRTAADAAALRAELQPGRRLTVLGGGFIGLEVAATAQALGLAVQVLESAPRLLGRSVSPTLSDHVAEQHRAAGIDLRLGVTAGDFEHDGERLHALSVDGVRQDIDLLLLGIGAWPDTALAEAAGLAVDNGVVVDDHLRTSDPAIHAVGDCARFPAAAANGGALRLESVQNATDQARCLAAALAGGPAKAYGALPWFWSDQGGLRLQMAGLLPAGTTLHKRPGPAAGGFSLLHYLGEQLVCAESVNAPMDHLMLRKLLEAGKSPAPAVACDPAVALKTLL